MSIDTVKAEEWRNRVVGLFQKLPQYNEKYFGFEIDAGHKGFPTRAQYYFVENGRYCNYFYDWREVYKKTTRDIDEAIYWILQDRIFNYVIQYEKEHRVRYIDGRRKWFKLEQEMYDIIGKPYSEIKRKEQSEIMRRNPFDDAPNCRLGLVEDYEKIENWIQESKYKGLLQQLPNMVRLLTLWRGKKGIPNFEKLFAEARSEVINFYNFLVKQGDEPQPTAIFKLIEHTEQIAKKYL